MEELLRKTEPVKIKYLEGANTPLHIAAQSLHFHSIHFKQPKWSVFQTALKEWFEIVRYTRKIGLSHTGYDYPDWRQYALLDFGSDPQVRVRTRLPWYKEFDAIYVSDLINDNSAALEPLSPIELLASVREGVESDTITRKHALEYIVALIHLKYILIQDPKMHDQLLPIYCSVYSKFINRFNFFQDMLKHNSYWHVMSSLHLFPIEIGLLDVGTFENKDSWMISTVGLIKGGLGL